MLVVDDHGHVRSLLVALLEDAGLRTFEADCGPAALALLEEHEIDIGCVLQDLSMPGMAGEEVIARMLERDPDLPIIVMSVYDEANGRLKLKDLAVAGYAQKPFDTEELVKQVRSFLKR